MVRKNFKATVIGMLSCSISLSQPFFPLGSGVNHPVLSLYADTTTNYLFAGGELTQANGINCKYIASWNGTAWDSTNNQLLSQVRSIEKFNNEIYIGGLIGWYDTIGNIIAPFVAKWDSSVNEWVNFGANANTITRKLLAYNNQLYVLGDFDTIGGIYANLVSRYDGTNWYAYPPLDTNWGFILDGIFYNGDLYVGGNFDSQVASNMEDIAKWDGTQWLPVSNGLSGFNTNARAFAVYQGKLIVAGYFNTAWGDPGNNIAAWDGTSWSQLGNGTDGEIRSLIVFNNELWAGGGFTSAGGISASCIAKWNGIQWANVGINLGNVVTSFAVLGNDLYIGGGFVTILNGDTAKFIMRYNYLTGFHSLEPEENEIKVYPNPAHDIITITFPPGFTAAQLILYDAMGRVSIKMQDISIKTEINIKHLPQGIYFYEVRNSKGEAVYGKIVKQ